MFLKLKVKVESEEIDLIIPQNTILEIVSHNGSVELTTDSGTYLCDCTIEDLKDALGSSVKVVGPVVEPTAKSRRLRIKTEEEESTPRRLIRRRN